MTEFLRNCWYMAGWSEEVGEGGSLARTIAGQAIVFFRDGSGELAALQDRCPHRFAPLSAGQVELDGIRCGYHGIAFDRYGACIDNPHGVASSALCARSFAVCERHTAFWVWLGEPDRAAEHTIPDLSFIDAVPPLARIASYLPTAANYELLTDNILDLSHADYLHASSLGGMMTSAETTCREDGDTVFVSWEAADCEPPPAFRPQLPDGARAHIIIAVEWQAPAVMVLTVNVREAGAPMREEDTSFTLHLMTPESARSTHYFFCNTRPDRQDDAEFTAFLRGTLTQAFAEEDKPMLEAQQRALADEEFESLGPALLPIDKASVLARRKLRKLLQAERSD